VAHFMNEDKSGKSETESGSVERPIKAEKCREAEQKFQLEDGKQNSLTFCQND